MAELLLLNPRRRRKKNSSRRRKHKARARRRNPARVSRRRRRNPAPAFMRRHKRRARRHNPIKHRRRRKHNPSFRGITGSAVGTLKTGAIGALGALASDIISGQITNFGGATVASIPYSGTILKLLSAVLIGSFGDKVFRGHGKTMALGAASVALHDLLKANLQSMAPSLFGVGGTLSLGAYVSGVGAAGPIVGASTVPVQPLFDTAGLDNPRFSGVGAYVSGPSGMTDSYGAYSDDMMGY